MNWSKATLLPFLERSRKGLFLPRHKGKCRKAETRKRPLYNVEISRQLPTLTGTLRSKPWAGLTTCYICLEVRHAMEKEILCCGKLPIVWRCSHTYYVLCGCDVEKIECPECGRVVWGADKASVRDWNAGDDHN